MLSATDGEPWVKHVFLDPKEEKSCLLPPTVLMPPLRLQYALDRTSTDRNSYPMSLQKWGATDKIKAGKLGLINQVTRGFGGGIWNRCIRKVVPSEYLSQWGGLEGSLEVGGRGSKRGLHPPMVLKTPHRDTSSGLFSLFKWSFSECRPRTIIQRIVCGRRNVVSI